ncbi:Putative protein of unknown function [Podospora comata]|uniref:Uncharacterized protein n=1 Tax=Podospora comata TaxID=48703 RepID=A0ABY6S8C1_PODCO|nr:Putative protein of unknown function [Podospora comata]
MALRRYRACCFTLRSADGSHCFVHPSPDRQDGS